MLFPCLTKAVRYRLCHISMAPKWSKYSVVILIKIADCLSYQGGALLTEPNSGCCILSGF